MTTDNCREAFEAWLRKGLAFTDGDLRRSDSAPERYFWATPQTQWECWQAAWNASPPVTRDDWLTERGVNAIDGWPDGAERGEIRELCNMARAAIRLYAERAALFTQLKAAIETVERGNV